MTNYEWLIKNWYKIPDDIGNYTVGEMFSLKGKCAFISSKYCASMHSCPQCFYNWYQAEATKDNNIYFEDIQD